MTRQSVSQGTVHHQELNSSLPHLPPHFPGFPPCPTCRRWRKFMPWRSVAGRRIGTFDASSFADIVCSLIAHQNEVQLCNQEHPGTYIYIYYIYITFSSICVSRSELQNDTGFFQFPRKDHKPVTSIFCFVHSSAPESAPRKWSPMVSPIFSTRISAADSIWPYQTLAFAILKKKQHVSTILVIDQISSYIIHNIILTSYSHHIHIIFSWYSRDISLIFTL